VSNRNEQQADPSMTGGPSSTGTNLFRIFGRSDQDQQVPASADEQALRLSAAISASRRNARWPQITFRADLVQQPVMDLNLAVHPRIDPIKNLLT
jgi:hypothetical protein